MKLDDALKLMNGATYTLWIGAGLTKYLGQSADPRIPDWIRLTEELEGNAGIGPPRSDSLPQRLDVCRDSLGEVAFQAKLREFIHDRLCASIAESARLYLGDIPPNVRRIARLGARANPIVNFNIEPLTSVALAMPGGPMAIRCYCPLSAKSEPKHRMHWQSVEMGHYQRIVYHPHGAINIGGLCVMTQRQYQEHEGTLAFSLATHAAFASRLVIVGMSLTDRYLREQLARFRDHIGEIIWFRDSFRPPCHDSNEGREQSLIDQWVSACSIASVEIEDWGQFWESVEQHLAPLNSMTEESGLIATWLSLVRYAIVREPIKESIYMFRQMGANEQQISELYRIARLRGEDVRDCSELPGSIDDLTKRALMAIKAAAFASWSAHPSATEHGPVIPTLFF